MDDIDITRKNIALKDFQRIPGVGKSIAQDFLAMGFHNVAELRKQDPEELYERLCEMQGARIDRCLLYVFRCAVYYASNEQHDPELLKWWNWKNRMYSTARPPQ